MLTQPITLDNIVTAFWSQGELDYLLHSSQLEYEQFVSQSHYIKNMLHCGRGWGKTWYLLTKAFKFAIRNPGVRIIYATQSRESVKKIVLPTFIRLTAEVPESVKPKWKSQDHSFEIGNGSTIVLEGADDDHGNKLRGAFAHMIICDEFGFWAHAENVAQVILLPQIQRARKHFPKIANEMKMFLVSTTPESQAHEFYHFKAECIIENTYFLRTVYDNPLLTEKEIEDYAIECRGKETTLWRREYLCEDVIESSKAVIPEFDIKRHVIDDYEVPRFRDTYVSADFAFVRDFTHILFSFYDFQRARIVIEDEICLFNDRDITTAVVAEKFIAKKKAIWTDSEGREQIPYMSIADIQPYVAFELEHNHNLSFTSPIKHDKEQAINDLREAMRQDKIVIHKRCQNLIDQLARGIWNNQRSTFERLPGLGHLDGVDALLYMWRAVDRNKNPTPKYTKAPVGNLHKYNEHMYKDSNSLDRLSDLYDQ